MKAIAGQFCAPLKQMPHGMSCSSSLTNTPLNVWLRHALPRVPSGFQSPLEKKPSDVARTPWVTQREAERNPQDYAPCQRLADEMRAANALRTTNASAIAAIR